MSYIRHGQECVNINVTLNLNGWVCSRKQQWLYGENTSRNIVLGSLHPGLLQQTLHTMDLTEVTFIHESIMTKTVQSVSIVFTNRVLGKQSRVWSRYIEYNLKIDPPRYNYTQSQRMTDLLQSHQRSGRYALLQVTAFI